MVTDTEHNYRGTSFVVISLILLLVLVGGYFAVAHLHDVYNDPATAGLDDSYGGAVASDLSSQ